MKRVTLVAMMGLAVGNVLAGQTSQLVAWTVTICLKAESNVDRYNLIVDQAMLIADRIFVGTGVKLDWHRNLHFCTMGPARAIQVDLSGHTPSSELPGALGYAQFLDDAYVRVFYDRVRGFGQPDLEPYLLGHVLAHEVTHVLQGTFVHAGKGVMKARWDYPDYRSMMRQSLKFTDIDLRLIARGLERRPDFRLARVHAPPVLITALE